MPRTVLELRCMNCGTRFEKSLEQKRRDPDFFSKGETIRLEESTCPNNCGGQWFKIEKQHTIRRFKRHRWG